MKHYKLIIAVYAFLAFTAFANAQTENTTTAYFPVTAATPIIEEYDCPDISANIGDPCQSEEGLPGVATEDCYCDPNQVPLCSNFYYFLSDHDAAEGISDIYRVYLYNGIAYMNYIASSDIEVHIAFNSIDNLIYAISKNENSYRTLDPSTMLWGPLESLGSDCGEITAAVFNQEGILLIGSQNHKVIYSVNINTNAVAVYDTYAPVSGGDLAFDSSGMLYLATRSGNGLYEVWTEPFPDNLIGSLPAKVSGIAITNMDQLVIAAQGNTSLVIRNIDGSNPGMQYDLIRDGEPYTLRDGDLASGCEILTPPGVFCDNFITLLANHGAGIIGSDIYSVDFVTGANAELSLLANVDFETHIAIDATAHIIYLVNADGSFVRLYDMGSNTMIGDLPITGDFNKLTAAAFNTHDGLLYVGDQVKNEIHSIDPATGISAYYADAPVSDGDLAMLDNGVLYLGTNEGSALYEIFPGEAPVNGGTTPPNLTGMARAGDGNNDFITSNNGANYLTRISAQDGSTIETYMITLNGIPFTLSDGDMASGCIQMVPSETSISGNCYATEVVAYIPGTTHNGGAIASNRTDATHALGAPERTDQLVFVSLGYGGSLTLGFDGAIPNQPGDDIEIVETSYGNPSCVSYPEYADVYVSVDGLSWHFAKTVCRTDGFVDISDAGDFEYISFVKIVNNNVLTTTQDGFDVDGVVALHNCEVDQTNPILATAEEPTSTLTSYPNPTNGPSKVVFVTGESSHTLVEVYDINGRNVATLFNQEARKDQQYTLHFNASNLPNGVYIYRLTTKHETIIEKFIIAR